MTGKVFFFFQRETFPVRTALLTPRIFPNVSNQEAQFVVVWEMKIFKKHKNMDFSCVSSS